jgi:hypothetical protein
MLIYVIGLLIVIWYVVVAAQSRGHVLVWPLIGLTVYIAVYWIWRSLLRGLLVRDAETLVWFLVAGMLIGLAVAVLVLAALVRGAVARIAARGNFGGLPLLSIDLPTLKRDQYLQVFAVAAALAILSVAFQKQGVIVNEIGPGGMYPAGLSGLIGGMVLRRPLRSILLGICLGLAYAACYAPGLIVIGKLPLRGGEAVAGALIGLPVLMIVSAAPAGLLGAVIARSIRDISAQTRWLASTDPRVSVSNGDK